MKKSRVIIYKELNDYQSEMIRRGSPLFWIANNENYDVLYRSINLNDVIDFANENSEVTHITKHTEDV